MCVPQRISLYQGIVKEKNKMIDSLEQSLRRKHGIEDEHARAKIDLKTVELAIKDLTVSCRSVDVNDCQKVIQM